MSHGCLGFIGVDVFGNWGCSMGAWPAERDVSMLGFLYESARVCEI